MIPTREIAGHKVGAIGHGLMGLTWTSNPTPDDQAFESMKAAADAGATNWNAGTFYGENYVNLKLLNRFFEKYPEYLDKIYLSVKGFFTPKGFKESFEEWETELKEAKEALGKKTIDLFEPARVPRHQPIEETMKSLVKLKEAGYFNDIGLSEAKADTVRRAFSVHPVAAVEIELSLWAMEPEVRKVLALAEELDFAVIGYSPLGRGFLAHKFKKPEDIEQDSHTAHMPRLKGQAFYDNLKLVDRIEELAKEADCEPAQLCLAYLLQISDKVIPIPGSSNAKRATSNIESANVKLSKNHVEAIDAALAKIEVTGERAPEALAAINWG